MTKVWFQQDGAAPYTAGVVLDWLTATFTCNRNLISLKSLNQWPPHSLDLNPLDFFLWGYLKDRVYIPPPETTEDLKKAIQVEMRKITKETCTAVVENFRRKVKRWSLGTCFVEKQCIQKSRSNY